MPSCSICIDELKCPMSLPCGHIFCKDCLLRAVDAIKPYSPVHFCPTCRSPYTIANIDPNLVPSHLRLHMVPSIRRVFLDESNPHVDISMSHRAAISECARLQAENAAMKINCALWRKRAEVHAGATLGLLALIRSAREHALKWKAEKDDLEHQINVLKRKLNGDEASGPSLPERKPTEDFSSSVTSLLSSSLETESTCSEACSYSLDDEQERVVKRLKTGKSHRISLSPMPRKTSRQISQRH